MLSIFPICMIFTHLIPWFTTLLCSWFFRDITWVRYGFAYLASIHDWQVVLQAENTTLSSSLMEREEKSNKLIYNESIIIIWIRGRVEVPLAIINSCWEVTFPLIWLMKNLRHLMEMFLVYFSKHDKLVNFRIN